MFLKNTVKIKVKNLPLSVLSHPLGTVDWNGATRRSFFISKKLFGAPPSTYSLPRFLVSSYWPTTGKLFLRAFVTRQSTWRSVCDLKEALQLEFFLYLAVALDFLEKSNDDCVELLQWFFSEYAPDPGTLALIGSTSFAKAKRFSVQPKACKLVDHSF